MRSLALVTRPIVDLVRTTDAIVCNPRRAASHLVAPTEAGIGKAATYFISAFSIALILNRVGLAALGLESLNDAPYWIVHAGVVLVISLAAWATVALLGSFAPLGAIKASLLAYGAAFLIGSVFIAGASLTIRAAQELGYIPPATIDFSLWTNTDDAFNPAVYDCLRNESTGFNVVYHAFFGHFETAHKPINGLSYILPGSYLSATVLLVLLVWFAATKRRWATAIAVAFFAIVVPAGAAWAASAYSHWIYEQSECDTDTIVANILGNASADHIKTEAAKFSARIGNRVGPGLTITDVEADERTLILRIRAEPAEVSEKTFRQWVGEVRQDRLSTFCNSDWGDAYRQTGTSHIWIIRYGDGGPIERIVEGADSCRE